VFCDEDSLKRRKGKGFYSEVAQSLNQTVKGSVQTSKKKKKKKKKSCGMQSF
jgi:hypothetical protein